MVSRSDLVGTFLILCLSKRAFGAFVWRHVTMDTA